MGVNGVNYRAIKDGSGQNYEFDGDLEQYLLDKGVSAEHINKMKCKILKQHRKELYEYYDGYGDYKEDTVLLKKVTQVRRGTVGQSVYENVRTLDGEREKESFEKCLEELDLTTLEEVKKWYEEPYEKPNKRLPDSVLMFYYEDVGEYYVHEGNHRTLTAMLIGAEKIKAKVAVAHYDKKKKKEVMRRWFFQRMKDYIRRVLHLKRI